MADTVEPRKLTAFEVLETLDRNRVLLFPQAQKERMLTAFYNSGPLPQDDDECGDDAPVSLGVGYRYVKRGLEGLMDAVLTKPGFIKTEVCYPLEVKRQFMVASAADKELNAIVQEPLDSVVRAICGRAMITGRGFLFRLSRWDWKFRAGRLICPPDAPDDICDSGFREWGFTGKMTLRDLDERLESTRDKEGFFGWSHTSLMSLKRYIIRTTFAEKEATTQWINDRAMQPFDMAWRMNVLDVYWYFRKSGKRNDEGEETVDLYCCSRWGATTAVYEEAVGGVTYKGLEINMPKDGNDIIFYLPDAFENVEECLIPMILDARIDGEQQMMQVDGVGKIMLPRLQSMEHLTMALLEGIAFGVQPNWTYTNAVDANTIKMFQKAGLNPWDAVPAGMTTMNKQQSMQGMSSALQMLQMLGMSAESDAQTGEMSPMGESQARFKAEAEQMLTQLDAGMTRRKERSFICLDKLAESITETLSRPFDKWKKGDPAYYDAHRYQRNMLMIHKVLPAEYNGERMKATCRRLAGNMERSQAAAKSVQVTQAFGGQMAPEGLRFLAKEGLRAAYDDSVADLCIPDQTPQNPDQIARAQIQNSAALVSLSVPQRESQDDPNIHLPVHVSALEARFRLAQQAGSITPFDREGMAALLVHTSMDARGVPPAQQMQIGTILQKMATVLQSIPLMGAQTELGLKAQAQQLKGAEFQFKQVRETNLVSDRDRKAQMKQQDFMLKLQGFLEQQRNNGVTRAAQLLDMMDATSMGADTSEVASQPAEA